MRSTMLSAVAVASLAILTHWAGGLGEARADQTDFSSCDPPSPNAATGSAATNVATDTSPFSITSATVDFQDFLFVSHDNGVSIYALPSFLPWAELSIDVGTLGRPFGLAVAPDVNNTGNQVLLVATEQSVEVYSIGVLATDTPRLLKHIPIASPCGGTPTGTKQVIATHDGLFAFTTNESQNCNAAGSSHLGGSVTAINLSSGDKQRTLVDKNPAGLVLGPSEHRLYVVNEAGGPVSRAINGQVGTTFTKAGSLMVFGVDTTVPTGTSPLTLHSAVNAGCTSVRVVVDSTNTNVWVTARDSAEVLVFSRTALWGSPGSSLVTKAVVGSRPTGLALFHNDAWIAFANSNRDLTSTTAHHPSMMVFSTHDILTLGTSAMPTTTFATGNFPREFGFDPGLTTLYMSNFDSAEVSVFALSQWP